MIFMYEEFLKEAMIQYKRIPYEKNELYKKYKLDMDLEEPDRTNAPSEEEWRDIYSEVLERFRIKFDAVICNGYVVHKSREEEEVILNSLKELGDDFLRNKLFNNNEDRFAAYTHAYSNGVMDICPNKEGSTNILFITTENPLPVQVRVRCKPGSDARLNEYYVSKVKGIATSGFMHEIYSEVGSKIEISMLHMEDENTDVFSLIKGRVDEKAAVRTNFICAGGRNIRHRNDISAIGEDSSVETNDAVVGFGSTKIDIGTTTGNLEKKTRSKSTAKAIMFDDSLAYIKGFAKITKGSEKSVSRINERGIISGKNARLYLIPDMSIDESDVIATHSGASAPVEEDKIFYLQTHGISDKTARFLIMAGLMSDIISRISDTSLQVVVYSTIVDKIRNKKYGIPEITDMREMWLPANKSTNR